MDYPTALTAIPRAWPAAIAIPMGSSLAANCHICQNLAASMDPDAVFHKNSANCSKDSEQPIAVVMDEPMGHAAMDEPRGPTTPTKAAATMATAVRVSARILLRTSHH